jgi:CIC family chloride channel protein
MSIEKKRLKDLMKRINRLRYFRVQEFFEILYKKLFLSHTNSLLLMAILTGVVAGFLSVAFRKMLDFFHHLSMEVAYQWLTENIGWFALPLIPVTGAILLVILIKLFPKVIVGGYTMPNFLRATHLRGGLIHTKEIFAKMVTATLTISTGGSAGVEGPIAQIGGAAGSKVGRLFSMSANRLQVLIATGSSAAVAAQFNAPLAGVLFAQEIIMLGQFQLESFSALVIASGVATAISRAYYSDAPVFGELNYSITYPEFPFYCLLGVLIGFLSYFFIRFFYATGDFFQKLKIPKLSKPIVGAFLVGCLGLIQYEVLGDGYHLMIELLHTNFYTIGFLALLVVLKILATSITLGSGNVGGILAPSLIIGAAFGSMFGALVQSFFPALNVEVGSYALIGMGSFLAATTLAPLTAIFLLFELTNDYHVIIPVMFAAIIGTVSIKTLLGESIDTLALAREGIHLEGGRELNVLKSVTIKQVLHKDFVSLNEKDSFATLLQQIPKQKTHYFPILNNKNELSGVVSFSMIRELILEEGLENIIIMKDIMESNLITIKEDEDLAKALNLFSIKDLDTLPVVSKNNNKKIIGLIFHRDIIDQYNSLLAVKDFKNQAA